MKPKQYILSAITLALLVLWIPVATEKLFDFTTFRYAVLRQPLPYTLAYIAIYILPVLEVLTVVLLVFPQWRRAGILLSTALMALFTAYIGLALLGAWGKVPCGCGSVISGMSWAQHFWFNLFFLGVSVAGIIVQHKIEKIRRGCLNSAHITVIARNEAIWWCQKRRLPRRSSSQ